MNTTKRNPAYATNHAGSDYYHYVADERDIGEKVWVGRKSDDHSGEGVLVGLYGPRGSDAHYAVRDYRGEVNHWRCADRVVPVREPL
jgi:hypothetical protein